MLMLAVKISRALRKRQLTPVQRYMPEKIEAKISRKNATPRPLHKGRHVLQSVKGETNLVETASIFSFETKAQRYIFALVKDSTNLRIEMSPPRLPKSQPWR